MKGLRAYDILMAAKEVRGIRSDLPDFRPMTRGWPRFVVDDAVLCLQHTVESRGVVSFDELPPVVIPFPGFWLEWTVNPSAQPTVMSAAGCQYNSKTKVLTVMLFECGIAGDGNCLAASVATIDCPIGDDWIAGFPAMSTSGFARKAYADFAGRDLIGADLSLDTAIVIFTLGLLGVKNVSYSEAFLPRSIRRHPGQFAQTVGDSHYVLDIPGARALRSYVESPGDSRQKRLHIVRGHFADYTEGAGLFGKLHGRYYVAPHVRGNAELGMVAKDYRVVA